MPMPEEDQQCIRCEGTELIGIQAKCSDMFTGYYKDHIKSGYVPRGLNIGGGDYVDFIMCLDCGQIQARFPINKKDRPKITKEKEWKPF